MGYWSNAKRKELRMDQNTYAHVTASLVQVYKIPKESQEIVTCASSASYSVQNPEGIPGSASYSLTCKPLNMSV